MTIKTKNNTEKHPILYTAYICFKTLMLFMIYSFWVTSLLQKFEGNFISHFFFSVSDANMPVNELVRLVRVYSTPWEEKSAALKKLHEDYESNQRQLNIAIKRLKLVETQVDVISKQFATPVSIWHSLCHLVKSIFLYSLNYKYEFYGLFQNFELILSNVKHLTRRLIGSSLCLTNLCYRVPTVWVRILLIQKNKKFVSKNLTLILWSWMFRRLYKDI